MPLPYSVVIATRNRQKELSVSLPLILSQQPPPNDIIVIDSSDDFSLTEKLVGTLCNISNAAYTVQRSRPGAALQRNCGAALARSPIVFLPDDDILWYPGVAAQVIELFERDQERRVVGVVCAESFEPPNGVKPVNRVRCGKLCGKRVSTVQRARRIFEDLVCPHPFRTLGQSLWRAWHVAPGFLNRNIVPVEWGSLGRMAIRTELLRCTPIEEALGRYSLYEDVDLSFRLMRKGMLLGLRTAAVFHDQAPHTRADAWELGVIGILNFAFAVCRNSPPASLARRQVKRYAWIKAQKYRQNRIRYHAALAALKQIDGLLTARETDVLHVYRSLQHSLFSAAIKKATFTQDNE